MNDFVGLLQELINAVGILPVAGVWLGCGVMGAVLMRGKGHRDAAGAIVTTAFGPLGLLLATVTQPPYRDTRPFMTPTPPRRERIRASLPAQELRVPAVQDEPAPEPEGRVLPEGEVDAILIDAGRGFPTQIVGESFRQDAIRVLAGDGTESVETQVLVLREPTNPVDVNAVQIVGPHGRRLGYIKGTSAIKWAPVLDELQELTGRIVATPAKVFPSRGNYGVWIAVTLPAVKKEIRETLKERGEKPKPTKVGRPRKRPAQSDLDATADTVSLSA